MANTNSLHSSHDDFADAMTQQNATPRAFLDLKNDLNDPYLNKKKFTDNKKKLKKQNV